MTKQPTVLVSVVYEKGADAIRMTRYVGKSQREQVIAHVKDFNSDFPASWVVENFRKNGIPE